ncbi:MAG: apolipoprotein A1/A4/E family protein [Bryobacteraceae bacterium]|nr:apolipoprotein A1/A4/E family protein [Bryobacteraceae bacterium]
MFSLRKQISHLDNLSETYQHLLEAWGAMMEAVVKHLPDAPKELFEEPRRQLKTIRAGVQPALDKPGITDTRDRFQDAVEDYGKKLTGYVRRQERETMEILDLLSSVADQFARRDKDHGGRMQSIARKLRLLTTGTDLAEIKWKLAQEVEQLERAMQEMTAGNQAALARLQDSLAVRLPPAAAGPQGPPVQRRPGRQCMALFTLAADDHRAQSIVAGFREPHDHFECLGPGEYALTKECSLMDMITVMEAIREQLYAAGFDCQAGAAERLRGEESDEFVRRARESTHSLAVKGF